METRNPVDGYLGSEYPFFITTSTNLCCSNFMKFGVAYLTKKFHLNKLINSRR